MSVLGLCTVLICAAVAVPMFAWAAWIGNRKPCSHKWALFREIDVYAQGYDRPLKTRYVLRCEHCGDLRKRSAP